MKKLLLLICLATALFSCKKESTTTKSSQTTIDATLLVGNWVWTQDTLKQYKNGVLKSSGNGGVTFDGSFTNQFNNDGTGIYFDKQISATFTYTVKGDKLTTITAADAISDEITETATIRVLTATKLVLYYDDTTTDPDDGAVYRVTEAQYYEKKK